MAVTTKCIQQSNIVYRWDIVCYFHTILLVGECEQIYSERPRQYQIRLDNIE